MNASTEGGRSPRQQPVDADRWRALHREAPPQPPLAVFRITALLRLKKGKSSTEVFSPNGAGSEAVMNIASGSKAMIGKWLREEWRKDRGTLFESRQAQGGVGMCAQAHRVCESLDV